MALAASTYPINTYPALTQAGDSADAVFDVLRNVDIGDSKKLAAAMTQVEMIQRKALALSIDLMMASESGGMHYQDGH